MIIFGLDFFYFFDCIKSIKMVIIIFVLVLWYGGLFFQSFFLTEEEIKLWESGHVFQDPWPKNIVKMIS